MMNFKKLFLFGFLIVGIAKASENPIEKVVFPFESISNFIDYLATMPKVCKSMFNGDWSMVIKFIETGKSWAPNFILDATDIAFAKSLTQNKIMVGGAIAITAAGVYAMYKSINNEKTKKLLKIAKFSASTAITIAGLITTIGSYGIYQAVSAYMR